MKDLFIILGFLLEFAATVGAFVWTAGKLSGSIDRINQILEDLEKWFITDARESIKSNTERITTIEGDGIRQAGRLDEIERRVQTLEAAK